MRSLRMLAAAVLMSISMLCMSAPLVASAATGSSDAACQGLQAVDPSGACGTKAGAQSTLTKVIRTALQLLSLVAGVIAVIMIIVAGLKYITSQGDSTSTASARKTLIYAIVGLVVVVMAQIIVQFVLKRASGT